MKRHEESVTSHRSSLRVRNLITDEGDPDRRNVGKDILINK
jgi:hypothetical protein